MIEAVNSLESASLVSKFSLSDLNDNLIDSNKEIISKSKMMSSNIAGLVTSNKRQELTLDKIHTGIQQLYSEAQSDDIQAMKLRMSVDGVKDAVEDIENIAPAEPPRDEEQKKEEGGWFDGIGSLASMLIFAPLKNAFTFIKEGIVTGISKIGKFISSIFSWPMKFLKGSKVSKFFSPLTKVFGFIGKIFKPFKALMPAVKGGLKLTKGIPIIGQVITAVMAIFDGISGWFNASDISGKSEETLTIGDKVMASISSIISGLSFGFLDVKKVFSFLSDSWDKISSFFSDLTNDVVGLFEYLTTGDNLKKTFLQAGDYISGIMDSVVNWIVSLFTDSKNWIVEKFTSSKEWILKKLATFAKGTSSIWDKVTDFFSDVFDILMRPFTCIINIGKKLVDYVSNINAKDLLPDSIKDSWLGKKVLSLFGGDGDTCKETKNDSKPTLLKQDLQKNTSNKPLNLASILPISDNNNYQTLGNISPIPNRIDNSDVRESKMRFTENQRAIVKASEDKQPIIVPQIQTVEKEVPVTSKKVMQIDDMGMNLVNSGVFG